MIADYDAQAKRYTPKVVMNTSGGAEYYEHVLVNYDSPMIYYDSGWYAWFYDQCPPDAVNAKYVVPPIVPLSNGYSIQDNWMLAYLNSLDKTARDRLASLNEIKQLFNQPWDLRLYSS